MDINYGHKTMTSCEDAGTELSDEMLEGVSGGMTPARKREIERMRRKGNKIKVVKRPASAKTKSTFEDDEDEDGGSTFFRLA